MDPKINDGKSNQPLILKFDQVRRSDGHLVGGKNSSIGEMISTLTSRGIRVPFGFATTSQVYWQYIDINGIQEKAAILITEWQQSKISLAEAGREIRSLFLRGTWPKNAAVDIQAAYAELHGARQS